MQMLVDYMDEQSVLTPSENDREESNLVVLTWRTRLCYGVGHILNDLCANVWFSYLLIYMQYVVQLSPITAGSLLLVGQIADALSTPFVGIESDRTGYNKYGRRKLWHLLGVTCVAVSFPFIFTKCIGCGKSSEYALVIYYVPFIVIFQFGWASTQISHLALIPELSECKIEKVTLNAIRYAGTVSSGIVVYLVFWYLINTMKSCDVIGPDDHDEFMYLALITVAFGLVFMFIFHLGVKERPRKSSHIGDSKSKRNASDWKLWFREIEFYKVALIYMCTRLVVNISQVYTPQFTKVSLEHKKEIVAIIPLIVFVSGFLTTLAAKPLNVHLGQRGTYIIGLLIVISNCVWTYFIEKKTIQVYGYGVLLGVGGSLSLVTCLGMLAHLIGENVETGAFVYGAMSFLDKIANGIAVQIIQVFHGSVACEACLYRHIIMYVPGGAAVFALLVAVMLNRDFDRSSAETPEPKKPPQNIQSKSTSMGRGAWAETPVLRS
ncbi:major facilitator superfamily domain-containing protein 12-like isoform X2 [Dendronephthya gigantea]|uniref:major facilitator superfamily domain-containing protein 12-like isoform X2 n=1 Tax=Dendronephthya gigantea TaxID=151771 RepID=UPI00106902E8|nr:major facilitator superfamily domain-containing protein 12-like isoform X2 [Dendronephthya gigantea]